MPTIRHLLGLQGLSPAVLRELLVAARDLPEPAEPVLRGRILGNLFFEDSTRTRTSFSVAAQKLGAGVVDLLGSHSSVNKGETLIDTARNVEAMGVDLLAVRARQSGAAAMLAAHVSCPIINAGDGRHEHPTQGLLDIYTIAESHHRLDAFDLKGLTVAIVGDVASSRVARSNIAGLTALKAKVVCVGPPAFVPAGVAGLGASITTDLESVLSKVDVVMMLRIQFERHGEGKTPAPAGTDMPRQAPVSSVREFRELYALTVHRQARLRDGAIVMHPGPINRGIELDSAVADGPRSVIMRQVTNGVRIRMAALRWCLGL